MANPLNDAIGQSFEETEKEFQERTGADTPINMDPIGPEWMQKYGSHVSDRVAVDAINSGYATPDMSLMQMFGAKMKMGLNPLSENSAYSYIPGTGKKWSEGGPLSQLMGGVVGVVDPSKKGRILKHFKKNWGKYLTGASVASAIPQLIPSSGETKDAHTIYKEALYNEATARRDSLDTVTTNLLNTIYPERHNKDLEAEQNQNTYNWLNPFK